MKDKETKLHSIPEVEIESDTLNFWLQAGVTADCKTHLREQTFI